MKSPIVRGPWMVIALALTLPPPASAQSIPPPPGLVGWWSSCDPLNVLDPSVTSLAGGLDGSAFNGVRSAPGMVGNSFEFDGPTEYLEIPENPIGQDEFTIETWVYWDPSLNPADRNYLMSSTEDLENGAGFFDGFALMTNTLGHWHIHFSSSPLFPSPVQTLPTRRWTHLAVVKDGNLLTYYMTDPCAPDQPQIGTASLLSPFVNSGSTLWIGGLPNHPGHFFGGRIDEPTIYDSALDAQEIAAIVQAGDAGKTPPAGTVCASGCSSSISGRVYFDVDGNGSWSAFEPVFLGRPVRLYCGNELVGLTFTGGSGSYTFFGVPPGHYRVRTGAYIPLPLGGPAKFVLSGFTCTTPASCSYDVDADCVPIGGLDFGYERGWPLWFHSTAVTSPAYFKPPQ